MAGLSKSLVEVGISMVLRDGFSQQAGRISSSYLQMMNEMNQWNRAVTQSAGVAFDYGLRAIETMTEAYKHYADISGEMFLVGKIAGATTSQQKDLLDLTRQVNLETPLTNKDIVSAERYLAMAGNDMDRISKMIRPVSQLAAIFQMPAGGKGGVADLMTNIMATFNIAAEDAPKTADILYTATTSANMSLTDLAQSLQYSGATFRNAGVDLATASAAIGVLGDQGIQASSAGTALANMIRYLTLSITGQKTKGTQMLEALGITRDDLVDAQGNLRDLGTLMGVLASHMQGLSGTAKEAALFNIFGVRGERAAANLINALEQGSSKMSYIISKANNSEGSLESAFMDFMNTTKGDIVKFEAALDNFKVTWGEAIAPILTPLVKAITTIVQKVDKFTSTTLGSLVARLTASVAIGATLVNGVRLLTGTFRIVVSQAALLNSSTNITAAGMGRVNTQATVLEAHLRTIVALMSEYVALSYAPGTKGMMLPMGGRLGRTKAGKPYVGVGGKAVSTATYAGALAGLGSAGSKAAGKAASKAAAGAAASRIGFMATAKTLGSNIFKFLGGWWGIGISAALTLLPPLIRRLSGSTEDNAEALNANTEALTSQSIMDDYMDRYTRAMVEAIQRSDRSSTVNISVNGKSLGGFTDGSTVQIDEDGLEYFN